MWITNRNIIFVIIVALPIIDIITTFTEQGPLSFGAIVRGALILLLFFPLMNHFRQKGVLAVIAFLMPFALVAMSFMTNFIIKQPFLLFGELQFHFKTTYFILMIFFALAVLTLPENHFQHRQPNIDTDVIFQATGIATLIIGISYWIAYFTSTSLPSYPYDKNGYSGWFFAANELSVIIMILFTFALMHFIKRPSWLTLFTYGVILSMTPFIGTKTAFFGVLIILIFAVFLYGVTVQLPKLTLILVSAIILIAFLSGSPIAKNISPQQQIVKEETKQTEVKKIDQVLSSRDTYFQQTKTDFLSASPIRKLFGLGYAGNYKKNPKTIEMDFYDLFFSYGVIGGAVIMLPLLLLTKYLLRFSQSAVYLLFLITYFLCFGIAFFVGHVIFAPAVMSYVAVLLLALGIEQKEAMHRG